MAVYNIQSDGFFRGYSTEITLKPGDLLVVPTTEIIILVLLVLKKDTFQYPNFGLGSRIVSHWCVGLWGNQTKRVNFKQSFK